METVKYPTLVKEMAVRKIKRGDLAQAAGISGKTFYNKMNGNTPFTLDEALAIKKAFFMHMTLEELFAK